jgi:hypothetical protein
MLLHPLVDGAQILGTGLWHVLWLRGILEGLVPLLPQQQEVVLVYELMLPFFSCLAGSINCTRTEDTSMKLIPTHPLFPSLGST